MLLICLFAFLLVDLTYLTASATRTHTFYFYSSELNIEGFSSLKNKFDTYFASYGNYTFQPFSDKNTFEKYVTQRTADVLLISSWHYKKLKDKISIQPVLVGVRNGKTMQNWLLVTKRGNSTGVEAVKNSTIASAANEDYIRSLLGKMTQNRQGITGSVELLTVPKDIDALMSLSFDLADYAVTTESSLDKLSKINPSEHRSLQVIKTVKNIVLPIIAVPKNNSAAGRLIKINKEMSMNREGKKLLKMIGLDGWKKVTQVEKNLIK